MKIDVQIENNIVFLEAQGEWVGIDHEKPRLHEVVKNHIDQGFRKYVLDLNQISFIDSLGVGEILASYVSILDSKGEFLTVLRQKHIKMIFQVTKIDEVIDIYDSIEEAKDYFD